jgi:hypothetical protein
MGMEVFAPIAKIILYQSNYMPLRFLGYFKKALRREANTAS